MRYALPILLLFCLPALAQDRSGGDTAGSWRVTHHQIFGIWNVFCDEQLTGDTLEERCYIRRVDVFSPAPKFAAQFLFITPHADGFEIDFGMERGTAFEPDGFRILADEGVIWSNERRGCLRGRNCNFTGEDAATLISMMETGESFRFTFTDRHGNPQDLNWELSGFPAALQDFRTVAAERGLM